MAAVRVRRAVRCRCGCGCRCECVCVGGRLRRPARRRSDQPAQLSSTPPPDPSQSARGSACVTNRDRGSPLPTPVGSPLASARPLPAGGRPQHPHGRGPATSQPEEARARRTQTHSRWLRPPPRCARARAAARPTRQRPLAAGPASQPPARPPPLTCIPFSGPSLSGRRLRAARSLRAPGPVPTARRGAVPL